MSDESGDDEDGSAPDTLMVVDSGRVGSELFSDSTGVGSVVYMSVTDTGWYQEKTIRTQE